jgi:hypothetical protein
MRPVLELGARKTGPRRTPQSASDAGGPDCSGATPFCDRPTPEPGLQSHRDLLEAMQKQSKTMNHRGHKVLPMY